MGVVGETGILPGDPTGAGELERTAISQLTVAQSNEVQNS